MLRNGRLEVVFHTYGSYWGVGERYSASDRLRILLHYAREKYCEKRRLETDTFRLCQIQKAWTKDIPVPHRLKRENFLMPVVFGKWVNSGPLIKIKFRMMPKRKVNSLGNN